MLWCGGWAPIISWQLDVNQNNYNLRMVKFSNKGKAKPSKRQSLKTKYKINRKVKQHRKKMKKQAKKLQNQGIKLKRGQKKNPLPNLFPFKNQILQHFKSLNTQPEAPGIQQLSPSEWGLITLQNKPTYFPKDKDHLTKKYITNIENVMATGTLFLEVLDSRNANLCLDRNFRQKCQKMNKKIISVISKIDTIDQKQLQKLRLQLQQRNQKYVEFTNDNRKKNACIEEVKREISTLTDGNETIIIVGKSNTGKHTLLKHLLRSVKFNIQSYSDIYKVPLFDNVALIDTPYKFEDDTGYPLFHVPTTLAEESKIFQEEKVLKALFLAPSGLNRVQFLMFYGIQDYSSLEDMLKKIGKANRIFGKGGMVDLGSARQRILSDWYGGKLNYMFD